jgi:hypothetical protein
MTVFSDLLDDVYTLTNRPDLVAETKLAVKAATLKMHQTDYYYKDLYETGISFLSADYVQQLEYRDLIPKWRALKYLRKSDSLGEPGDFISLILPEQVLDTYGQTAVNVCYMAGDLLQIRSDTKLQYALLGCYVHPTITEVGYSSWIALDHPYAIVYEAARAIADMTGLKEDAASLLRQVAEQVQIIKVNNIVAEGF